MTQHKENDFVIPALKVINDCEEGCTMEYLKRQIKNYMELTEEDNKPYPSRNPNEPRYYQVVGNLFSHHNALLFDYINVQSLNQNEKKTINMFTINEKGRIFLEKFKNKNQKTINSLNDYNNILLEEKKQMNLTKNEDIFTIYDEDFTEEDFFDEKIKAYALRNGLNRRPPTDYQLKETVIELNGYKCEYAIATGKRHYVFKGKSKKPYLEGHHLIPMKAAFDFFPHNLDRPSNLVSLCPGCHALLHHATKEDKIKVLKVLYDNHIEQLRKDGIYISFEKLLDQYYK
ncbi:MAG: hypothetical protein HFG31_04465 [Eubacterium sp.]|nr:hypothetical protein [Eubacterium sp.]